MAKKGGFYRQAIAMGKGRINEIVYCKIKKLNNKREEKKKGKMSRAD